MRVRINASLTNEFYIAGAYFTQDFVPKNFAATAGNPYQGVFANGSKVQPTMEDYGNDGLPLLRTPDATYGGIFAKKSGCSPPYFLRVTKGMWVERIGRAGGLTGGWKGH